MQQSLVYLDIVPRTREQHIRTGLDPSSTAIRTYYSPINGRRVLATRQYPPQGPITSTTNAIPHPTGQAMSRAISDNLKQHPKLNQQLGVEGPSFLSVKMRNKSTPNIATTSKLEPEPEPSQGTGVEDEPVARSSSSTPIIRQDALPSVLFLHVDPSWDPRQGKPADVYALPPQDLASSNQHPSRLPRGREHKSSRTVNSFLTLE